LLLGRLLGGW